tara:strand:- start:13499 stop:14152 length:654 start_codon:yes stop_codon:yes gene_type:complete
MIFKEQNKKWPKAAFCFLKLFLLFTFLNLNQMNAQEIIIPDAIKKEALTALSHYPELKETKIEFKFKENIKKSIMQAQPSFWSLFKSKKKRSYKILMSKTFKIDGQEYKTKNIPANVMIGWLGHELGHIMDYKNRSSLNLIWFGIKYTLSDNHIKEAEKAADSYAVQKDMENYILETKNFILNKTNLSEKYKARIKKYYLSPDEIMTLVEERDKVNN